MAGVVAYNWWVVVPFVPGLMPSVNGFFSDLEATGRPHADADVRRRHGRRRADGGGPAAPGVGRPGTASAGSGSGWWPSPWPARWAVGTPTPAPKGLSATCRQLEWHLQLPIHHYVHVVSGIAEFATLTDGRRDRHAPDPRRAAPVRPASTPAASRCWSSAIRSSAWCISPTVWGRWSSRSSSWPSRSWCWPRCSSRPAGTAAPATLGRAGCRPDRHGRRSRTQRRGQAPASVGPTGRAHRRWHASPVVGPLTTPGWATSGRAPGQLGARIERIRSAAPPFRLG